jgi:hypothetical protein
MSVFPDDVINATKTVADYTTGLINEGTKTLLQLLDPQNKNIFEMLIYPASLSGLLSIGTAVLDTIVAKLHVQSITMNFPGIEYQTWNEEKVPTGVLYPEEISITFLENDLGIIRNYMDHWFEEILYVNPITGEWVFRDNQVAAKKNAIIIPQMKVGLPSTAWIQITGMKYKVMEGITLSHADGDPMMLTVTFAVDNVWWKTLAGLL